MQEILLSPFGAVLAKTPNGERRRLTQTERNEHNRLSWLTLPLYKFVICSMDNTDCISHAGEALVFELWVLCSFGFSTALYS